MKRKQLDSQEITGMNVRELEQSMINMLISMIELLLFAALLIILIKSPSHLVYDEANTLPTIAAFQEYGLTSVYLNSLTHGSGPLFGAMYSLLSVISHDDAYRLRFINYGLTLTLVCLLSWVLRREQFLFAKPLAGAVIAIPTVWVCTGIAMDDILGLVLLLAALIPLGKNAFESVDPPWKQAIRFLLAGFLIGLASLDRQPFVLASVAVLIASIVCRRQVQFAALTPVVSILMLAPVMITWRGLTPPHVASHAGLSLEHCIISVAYGGLFTLIIAPLYMRIKKLEIWLIIICSFGINATFGVIVMEPARNLMRWFIPERFLEIYGLGCGSVLIGLSILYGISIVMRMMECRKEASKLVVHCGLILLLAWPIIMKLQYSSRYTLMALPFLILAVKDHYRANLCAMARTLAGGLVGAAVLWTYYNS